MALTGTYWIAAVGMPAKKRPSLAACAEIATGLTSPAIARDVPTASVLERSFVDTVPAFALPVAISMYLGIRHAEEAETRYRIGTGSVLAGVTGGVKARKIGPGTLDALNTHLKRCSRICSRPRPGTTPRDSHPAGLSRDHANPVGRLRRGRAEHRDRHRRPRRPADPARTPPTPAAPSYSDAPYSEIPEPAKEMRDRRSRFA
jgi:hypothetical protein